MDVPQFPGVPPILCVLTHVLEQICSLSDAKIQPSCKTQESCLEGSQIVFKTQISRGFIVVERL